MNLPFLLGIGVSYVCSLAGLRGLLVCCQLKARVTGRWLTGSTRLRFERQGAIQFESAGVTEITATSILRRETLFPRTGSTDGPSSFQPNRVGS